MAVSRAAAEPSLLPLFAWLSPAYPVGSYAYSHATRMGGRGRGRQRRSPLWSEWLRDLVDMGVGRNDAILLSHAYRSIADGDTEAFGVVNDLALARCRLPPNSTSKRRQQGRSFLDATACGLAVIAVFP